MMIGNDTAEAAATPEVRVVQTNEDAKDGQNKCPKCGSTDIAFNINSSLLRCNFCRHEFEQERATGLDADLSQLEGKVVGSGATDIIAGTEDIITLKCDSCGAEVVVDTSESMSARCHWCRSTLSIAQQIPNGSVPDMVLPFSVTKGDAETEIDAFVKKRQFFAHPTFKAEFCSENVMGVYLPYMIVGKNTHASFSGQGERLVRQYTVGTRNNRRTVYDADLYDVERQFDLVIDGLTITSSSAKLENSSDRTNNIINAIKPFDHENCVKWDANYLRGSASEKRDTNIEDLQRSVEVKAKDIARHSANETMPEYDRGVRWRQEKLEVKGQQWKAAYLPIWLYSYQQKMSDGNSLLHYVAVNARSKKTMGSVPVNKVRLFLCAAMVQIIGSVIGIALTVSMLLSATDFEEATFVPLALLASGFVFYSYYYRKYRNTDARFKHETDTRTTISNVVKGDKFVKHLTRLSDARMGGANNLDVGYNNFYGY